jgi:hypothetical protein
MGFQRPLVDGEMIQLIDRLVPDALHDGISI